MLLLTTITTRGFQDLTSSPTPWKKWLAPATLRIHWENTTPASQAKSLLPDHPARRVARERMESPASAESGFNPESR
jgi:hypothetical protein